jgi:predicted AAA+ superfamily ATPase
LTWDIISVIRYAKFSTFLDYLNLLSKITQYIEIISVEGDVTMKRPVFQVIRERIEEPRQFIQVLLGPRQVGKTTLVNQLSEGLKLPYHYASADLVILQNSSWIKIQWDLARTMAGQQPGLLVIDEIQKIPNWSNQVKALWDEDTRLGIQLKVLLLGSSPWLMQKGLTESLAGRFEVIPITHWTYAEMHTAFNWSIEEYAYFGGYPGAAALADRNDVQRWMNYINDALIETTISRDILLMTQINKPALLRRLFQLGCSYSGQILSFQKMLGQLQEAGNTTTLAHYLDLLQGAGLLANIQKYANQTVRQRASSPKLQVMNTALMTAQIGKDFKTLRADPELWGRLIESMIGAHLINAIRGKNIELFYWREGDYEVDFILKTADYLTAIEVKSNNKREHLSGLEKFNSQFQPNKILLVGEQGISFEQFLLAPIETWVR